MKFCTIILLLHSRKIQKSYLQCHNDLIFKNNQEIQPSWKQSKLYINRKVSIEALKNVSLLRFSDFFKTYGHLGGIFS